MKKLFISLLVIALSTTASYAKRTKTKYIDYVVRSGDSLFAIAKNHHTTTIKIRNYNGLAPEELIRVGQSLRIPTNKYISSSDLKKQIKKKTTKTKISKRSNKSKSPVEYKVQSGDTLFSIARKHHTTTREILTANNLDRDSIIKVGLVLNVPRDTYFPEKSTNSSKKTKVTNKKVAKKPAKKTVTKKIELTKSKADKKQIKTTSVKKGKRKYTIEKGDTLYSIAQKHHTTTKEVMDANGMKKGALIRVGQLIKVPTNTYFTDEKIIKNILARQEEKERTVRGIHKVKSGDTLFSIAMKNHVSLKDIMKYNKLKVNSVLKIGQELKVTKKASFVTAKKSTKKKKSAKKKKSTKTELVSKKYKIRRGDTLSKIAKRYKISVKKLRSLNGLSRRSTLRVGKILVVGKKIVKPKTKRRYIVKRGDTVWLIAKKNNTTVKEIRRLNHLTRKSKIKKGMVLSLAPKSKKSRKSTRLASKKKTSKSRRSSALSVLNGRSNRSTSRNSKVIRTAKRYLGKRYVWGAVGPNKFDCSGFTQYVIRKSKGVKLPRVSRKQAYYGKYVSRSNLRPGDLIFFDTSRRRRGYVNHVGIYIGANKFIHASSAKHRVVITSLNRPFYKARFKWGRRVN